MKRFRFLAFVLSFSVIGACTTLGAIVGNMIISDPEMVILVKVLVYLLVTLMIVGAVLVMLIGTILAIGKGLGLSQGDTRSALQAAIALARSSDTFARLYNKIPKGLLPPAYGAPQNYYHSAFGAMGQVINGEATAYQDAQPSKGEAWE